MKIDFTVHGVPQPQGSAKAFIPKGWSSAVITSDNKTLKPWRQDVAALAGEAMQLANSGGHPSDGPVIVTCVFWFAKPRSTPRRVTHKITKPDVDKLVRGILDALTGIVFRDDAQVVECHAYKAFADAPGARIIVEDAVGCAAGVRSAAELEI